MTDREMVRQSLEIIIRGAKQKLEIATMIVPDNITIYSQTRNSLQECVSILDGILEHEFAESA